MNVLFVSGEYPPLPGGISDYTALLAGELNEQGVSTQVLSSAGSSAALTVERWSWRVIRLIQQEIARRSIDLVHIQYQTGAFGMHPVINILPRLLNNLPVVTTFHDLLPPYLFPKAGRLRDASVIRLARWSDATVVTNPADERQIESRGIRTHEIPLGPSLPLAGENIQPGNHVGFFGYPSVQKGFDVLVRALGQIDLSARPALTVIGSLPADAGIHGFLTISEAEQLALHHEVELSWTGRLSPRDASNALAACGAIAFPYPGGATLRSSALIAALHGGRPVIATLPRFPGDLRGLEDMQNLTLVPAGESEPVANTISTILSTPSVSCVLPDAFRWETIADRHRTLYSCLLKEVSY
jgi:glycosyltransferase involved in cell wall biosynthesis